LVLRIGGPALLYTFNRLNLLPSASLIYKSLKNKINLEFNIADSVQSLVYRNIKQFYQNKAGFFTLKMDELSLVAKIRYYTKDNIFVGTCSNHNLGLNYQFNNYADLENLQEAILSNETHLANEALVMTISPISEDDHYPRPILVSPICNHSNNELINEAIKDIVNNFETLNPHANILNVATDGDPSRRKTLNSMRKTQTHLFALNGLKLFDQSILLGIY
jgi:hypothetical protein